MGGGIQGVGAILDLPQRFEGKWYNGACPPQTPKDGGRHEASPEETKVAKIDCYVRLP